MTSTFDVSNSRRTGVDLIRWGGLAAVLAGAAWVASGIAHFALVYPAEGTGPLGSTSAYLIEVAHAVAEAGMLGALLGLHARQTPTYGRLGKVGFVVAFLGTALVFVATVLATVLMSVGEAESWEIVLVALFGPGVLSWLVGFPLLSISTLRARVLPRWCGVLLLAYFPLFVFLLNSYGWGGIALGLLWLALGYALLSQKGTANQRSTAGAVK